MLDNRSCWFNHFLIYPICSRGRRYKLIHKKNVLDLYLSVNVEIRATNLHKYNDQCKFFSPNYYPTYMWSCNYLVNTLVPCFPSIISWLEMIPYRRAKGFSCFILRIIPSMKWKCENKSSNQCRSGRMLGYVEAKVVDVEVEVVDVKILEYAQVKGIPRFFHFTLQALWNVDSK